MAASPQLRGVVAAVIVGALVSVVGAEESPTDVAREALAICRGVGTLPAAERVARLGEGLTLAERAKQEDPTSALAQYAAFCNRGKRLQLEGFSFHAFGEIRRLRQEIDRALELAPEWPDAVAGKGALLVALPRFLGGDVAEGERLLRRALTLDPTNVEARMILQQLETDAAAAQVAVAEVGFLR